MKKRGRPKIYYDFTENSNKYKFEEPLDSLLREGIISLTQHRLALKLRWIFTVNFGLPTVQAYNISKVRGRDISKYDEESLCEIRAKYKQIIESLHYQDKESAKAILNIIIHHKKPSRNIELIKIGAQNLETAFNISKKNYNTINKNTEEFKKMN
jgi:hypothetical protein